jgi:hypothetical protein
MKNYDADSRRLKSLSSDKVDLLVNKLIEGTPEGVWPEGFPASIDPRLVFIGVSYGNSPDKSSEAKRKSGSGYFKSSPSAVKDLTSHFYYPDTRSYWEKLRLLSNLYFSQLSEVDAISLTTHINLGTGSAGGASVHDVEERYVRWASRLINYSHNPDLVILFGLWGIIRDSRVTQWWNHRQGINVDWARPSHTLNFPVSGRIYRFRAWTALNANGHLVKVVIWPNHPSRPPFGSLQNWKKSVDDFILWQDSIG